MFSMTTLLSLPPAACPQDRSPAVSSAPFIASDPPGRQLGSGGGTVHLLLEAWKASGVPSFRDWLAADRKMIIHGSGQSRRLPAYAAEGKLRLPLPPLPDFPGRQPMETLLDLQIVDNTALFRHAPDSYAVMITCGDALVHSSGPVPAVPEADVLVFTLPASPEEASHHGVLFTRSDNTLEFFLQKPSPAKITSLAASYTASLDTGVWLLSPAAVDALFRKCGLDPDSPTLATDPVEPYELYDTMGTALGLHPSAPDSDLAPLASAAVPLPDGRFYHFGTNRSVFASLAQLARPAEGRRSFGAGTDDDAVCVLHSDVAADTVSAAPLWIDASVVPASWTLSRAHVLTGIPDNGWNVSLPPGACVDLVPVTSPEGLSAFRVYGFDDTFKGPLSGTSWLGAPALSWFSARGIDPAEAGIDPEADIQTAPLFPLVDPAAPDAGELLQYLLTPEDEPDLMNRWLDAPRVSAADLLLRADVDARAEARASRAAETLCAASARDWESLAGTLDLEATSKWAPGLRIAPPAPGAAPSLAMPHLEMFRSRLDSSSAPAAEAGAFSALRTLILSNSALRRSRPRRNTLEDQIVWGRAPARLDLAGGWSDTPPYCLEHGGRVVNVGVNLNGQPPIQVFGRVCPEPKLVLHSIDLGISESIETFEELVQPSALGGFSIARAALRLAGFDPAYHADASAPSLQALLKNEFGGGIELSLLAAIPKGSGLGTSSILAGTTLGVLSDLCGLHWSPAQLYERTSALEQILTSGGGWQDQIGGLAPGLKLVTTQPGLAQTPDIRWLPDAFLADASSSGRALLYYTGITRVARNILSEIVRGIFLNDRSRISIIREIAANADFAADAIQRQSWTGLQEAVRRSWRLNQALDSGTNPPQVQSILDRIADFRPAAKLLGAGGGGYLLLLADDPASAARIRETLADNPPNPRARFVDLSVSATGLQITRS